MNQILVDISLVSYMIGFGASAFVAFLKRKGVYKGIVPLLFLSEMAKVIGVISFTLFAGTHRMSEPIINIIWVVGLSAFLLTYLFTAYKMFCINVVDLTNEHDGNIHIPHFIAKIVFGYAVNEINSNNKFISSVEKTGATFFFDGEEVSVSFPVFTNKRKSKNDTVEVLELVVNAKDRTSERDKIALSLLANNGHQISIDGETICNDLQKHVYSDEELREILKKEK